MTANARFRVFDNDRLRLPKIGDVPVRWSWELLSEPNPVTVTVDAAGRYHASFVVEVPDKPLPSTRQEVGIDLGRSTFAALSDGRKLDNPRFARRVERKLAKAQRALSWKRKGSKNRMKARLKVARSHAKVRDTRQNWLHQESTRVIRENQAVYMEDLAVSGLARTRMARSVHDGAGRVFGRVDRWFPSTRLFSTCGALGEKKPLNVRDWTCRCGAVRAVLKDEALPAARV